MRDTLIGRSARLGLFLALGLMASPLAAPLATPAAAQQQPSAAQVALARDLVVANGEVRAFEGVLPNLVDGAALFLAQTNPDLVRQLREVVIVVRPEFEARQAEITEILAGAYAARFSEAELKEALAFYRTATGKKLVADRPYIVQQSAQGIQAWSAQVNAQAIQRIREEMKKKGFDL